MSEFDAAAGSCLSNWILPTAIVVILIAILLKNLKSIRQRFFVFLCTTVGKQYTRDMDVVKQELFRELSHLESADRDLKNKGLIRILEIGVGPGYNFKFYPKNSRVIAVDPNPYFDHHLRRNCAEFSNVKLEQVVKGVGEDLSQVEDGSIDVVITTVVLCSVQDVDRVLREVRRVLAPYSKWCEAFHQKAFADWYAGMIVEYHEAVDQIKSNHFLPIREVQSYDASFKKQGLIRILEIGVGPGMNVKYYPKNAFVIAVDPNPFFMKYCHANISKCLRAKLERVFVGAGEHLQGVESDSVDVVVTTATLCSVEDVQAVLQEIHRVLVPGGKYFFFEHVLDKKGTKYRFWQFLVAPFWCWLFGCHVDRDICCSIQNSGLFSKIEMRDMTVSWPCICRYVVGPHIIGTAQK